MPAQPPPLPHVYSSALDEETARRNLIRQRAVELKRALAHSTFRIANTRVDRMARTLVRVRRRGVTWQWLCVAALSGALSMLVPVASSTSLRGQLGAAQPGTARRAVLLAEASECSQLSLQEPAWVNVAQLPVRAQIAQLVPRSGGTCQVELLLEEDARLQALAAGTALVAVVPKQPGSWLAALASDRRVTDAANMLLQRAQLLADQARSLDLKRHWYELRELFAG